MQRAPAYPSALANRLIDAIKFGVEIGFTGDRGCSRFAPNASSSRDSSRTEELISAGIAKDVAGGFKRGPFDIPPFEHFRVSPLGSVPKGDGIRIIHNLSHPFGGDSVNAGIPREEYNMMCFDDALATIRRLGRGTLLSKFDVRSAFKLVPVRPADRPLLGLCWQNKYYYEVVLPFGLRTSGYRWEEFAKALAYFCSQHLGVTAVVYYVDDFLLLAPPAQMARAAAERRSFEALCKRLGVPIADEKTCGPATTVVFLGIELDTERMECSLTEVRRLKLRELLQGWAVGGKHFTCDELMSLVGKLQFATVVIRAGATFLRRIRSFMNDMKGKREKEGTPMGETKRLNVAALLDVQWWLNVFLTTASNRRPIRDSEWIRADALVLETDACDTGYGARWGNKWFRGQWSPRQLAAAMVTKRISMPYLELHALTQAAVTWGPQWYGRRIIFLCDAEAVVKAVQKMRSRRDNMSALLRLLFATAARCGFEFICEHLAGKLNVVADLLSREPFSFDQLAAAAPGAEREATPTAPLEVDLEPAYPDQA